MSLGTALSELFKSAPKPNELVHGKLTSTRLWMVVGFVALLIWGRNLMSQESLQYAFWLAVIYLVCNTISKGVTTVSNCILKCRMIDASSLDGVFSEQERQAVSSAKAE